MAEDIAQPQPTGDAPTVVTIQAGRLTWPTVLSLDGPLVPVALYLLAVALLAVRIGSHPAFPYNWETYTARDVLASRSHSTWAILDLSDGVMTDSGRSPLIAPPIWLSFRLCGVSLPAMRLPIVLLAGLAVPLTWLVGRRLAGSGTAALGAALLALSPVFLLYGRTATLVGISLVPALLTIYALLHVLDRPRGWRWLLALQLLLLLDAYAYAPIRFLWPLSLILFAGEVLWRRGERRWFFLALVVTALAVPLSITGAYRYIGYGGWDKDDLAIVSYYSGHGEQLANLRDDPIGIQRYVRSGTSGQSDASATELALRLVRQNTTDLGTLLLDRHTRPAITDYWNPQGRLYPWFLLPFFIVGTLVTVWRAFSRPEARAWLVLFWGCSLPLVLTSRVHIGRLIFIVPVLMLFVALGMTWTVPTVRRALGAVPIRIGRRREPSVAWRGVTAVAVVVVLLTVARSTWSDYRIAPPEGQSAKVARILAEHAGNMPSGAGVVLALAKNQSELEIESLMVGGVHVILGDRYRFVDLAAGDSNMQPSLAGARPPVYYGGVLVDPSKAPALPLFCDNLYVVPTSNVDAFRSRIAPAAATCPTPLHVVTVPD